MSYFKQHLKKNLSHTSFVLRVKTQIITLILGTHGDEPIGAI